MLLLILDCYDIVPLLESSYVHTLMVSSNSVPRTQYMSLPCKLDRMQVLALLAVKREVCSSHSLDPWLAHAICDLDGKIILLLPQLVDEGLLVLL